jgi:hypothetical protein
VEKGFKGKHCMHCIERTSSMRWRSMNIEGGRRFYGQEVKFKDAKSGVGKDFSIEIRSRDKSIFSISLILQSLCFVYLTVNRFYSHPLLR